METVTAPTGARAPDPEDSRRHDAVARRRLWWWLPVVLAAAYALVLVPVLPAIIGHTWWSADSGSAGYVAQLYSRPAPGQYIVLGNHGWYETLSFYLLTRTLPGHELLWHSIPVAVWAITIALVGLSAARAFGRYAAALAIAALLCMAPGGLMLIFQPTAHTNVIFHAALLAVVAGLVLPRVRVLPLAVVIGTGLLIGGFTGLALAGDAIALVWAVIPFVVACGVCVKRVPVVAAARTLAFALATLIAMLIVTVTLTAIMHRAGIRVDEFAQSREARFVQPDELAGNVGKMIDEIGYVVGGNFLGHRMNRNGFLELMSGGLLLLGAAAVLVAVSRGSADIRERLFRGDGTGNVTPRLVHVAFWSTCLVGGLLMFLLSTVGSSDYRYLLGPVVAVAALLPVCAARGGDWRLAVAGGISVLALAGIVRLDTRPLPYLPADSPLASTDMTAVTKFAHRYHVTDGYSLYWDAVTISTHTHYAVKLHSVIRCGRHHAEYCALYHADSFTAAYLHRRDLRTLFVADARFRMAAPRSWGKPIATEQVGRLTLYAYPYDIANRFPPPRPGEIREVITGKLAPRVPQDELGTAPIDHVRR